MRRGSTRGLTLIEVIITSFCLVMLSGVLMYMLVAGKTIWQASAGRSGPVQDLRVAMRRIEVDLSRSKQGSVTVVSSDSLKAFSLLSAENSSGTFVTTSDGEPSWQKQVVYYLEGTGLRRKDVYGEYSEALSSSALEALCDGSGTMLAPSVVDLGLTVDGRKATLTLEAKAESDHGEEDSLSTETVLYIRN